MRAKYTIIHKAMLSSYSCFGLEHKVERMWSVVGRLMLEHKLLDEVDKTENSDFVDCFRFVKIFQPPPRVVINLSKCWDN